jgi:predicted ArsR family transcriptional regulator
VEDLDAVALLQEPLRRRLYEYVVSQNREVSRAEAAQATGAQRTLVAFHLDKLVEAGLLATTSRRVSGRSGPGAGRPAKLYARATGERHVSLPPRDYRTVADLLADVAEEARLDVTLQAAARRRGETLRDQGPESGTLDEAIEVLARRGYEPFVDGSGPTPVVRMRNCPFHALSESHPTLVCGMNLALLEGLLGGVAGYRVRMDARPHLCCVALSNDNIA